MTARFIIFYNGGDRPYVHPDHPLTRAEAVNHIKGDYEAFHSVVSFELGKPSLDVTKGIVAEVIEIWADNGEPLSYRAWEFVELQLGHQTAREFAMEDA
jgi:hypothetical protein